MDSRPVQPTEPTVQAPPPAAGAGALLGLVLGIMAISGYFYALPILGPGMQAYFSLTNRQLGTLLGCGMLGGMVSLPFVGPAIARWGVRRVLQVGLLGCGFGWVLCGVNRALVPFEMSLMVAGFFGATLGISGMALAVALYPQAKRRIITLSSAAFTLPAIVFPPLLQYLLHFTSPQDHAGFGRLLHMPLIVVGVVLFAGGLLLGWGRLCPTCAPLDGSRRLRWRELLRRGPLLIVALGGLHGASDGTLYSWMPRFLAGNFGRLILGAGVVLALYNLGYLLARLALAAMPEGIGQRRILTLVGPVGGVLVLLGIWRGDALAVALLYPLAGMIWCLEYPTVINEAETSDPAHFGAILVGIYLASMVLTFAELNLVGWMVDLTGNLRAAVTIPAAGFLAFGLLAAVSGAGRRSGSAA